MAAAVLYIACSTNENKTQKDIAEAARVTEVTVRNRYKALKNGGLTAYNENCLQMLDDISIKSRMC